MKIRGAWRFAAIALSLASFGIATAAGIPAATPPPKTVGGDFELTDHNRQPFALSSLRGKIVLLFFGYTHCPDVCPMELGALARALRELGSRSQEVRGLFVTVDPERDSPEVLKSYVRYFNDSLIGLTGSPEQIASVARRYHVGYKKRGAGEAYTMDHGSNLFFLDRQGRVKAIAPFGVPAEYIVEVVKNLLAEPG